MEIIRIPWIVHDTCGKHLKKGRTVGFVPTMGALHDGHLSLVKRSRNENDVTTVSIFVNPIQFGPSEDLEQYPRDLENDIQKLRDLEVDILFLPDSTLMYPEGFSTSVTVGKVSEKLCGLFRPGHFAGVATVVAKLFNIVSPTRAYFGRKDFQQTVVIKRMVRDLNFSVEVVVCPTVREHDGLAMSSRNVYLGDEERRAAASLYRCLTEAEGAVKQGIKSATKIRDMMRAVLSAEPLITRTDYASVYDPETLDELEEEIEGEVLFAVAARLGKTRLIDNALINA